MDQKSEKDFWDRGTAIDVFQYGIYCGIQRITVVSSIFVAFIFLVVYLFTIDAFEYGIYCKQIDNQKYEGIMNQKSEKDFWDPVTEYEKVWRNMEQKETGRLFNLVPYI